jgi:DNA-binding SARP family transcriptional activator/streptogramin lyase
MATTGFRFRLLGPLEVLRDGEPQLLGGERQRGLLVALLLHVNEVVATEHLAEQLFGADASEASVRAVRVAISRLRRLLDDETLATRPGGYLLCVEPEQLDVTEFEGRVAEGRIAFAGGDFAAAAASFTSALALFRGPPLVDLASLDFVQPEIRRLEELRLSTIMDRLDADLARGGGAELVPELETLVQTNPFQERLRGQLMLALYRSGRQTDALDVYRRTRELLANELGLEPSRALQALERGILQHDPALEVSPVSHALDPPAELASHKTHRDFVLRGRGRWLAAAVGIALAAAIAVAIVRATDSHARGPTSPVPLGDHLQAAIPSSLPSCCAFGFGGVWVVGHHNETVEKIDPSTSKVVARYRIAGFQAVAPLIAAGSLWVPAGGEPKFVRFDPVHRRVIHTFPIKVGQIAWGYNSIWVTTRDHQLERIDLRTNRIAKRIRLMPGYNDFDDAIAIGYGSIWVTTPDTGTLLRIDPETMKIKAQITGFGADDAWESLTTGDGSVWTYSIAAGHGIVYRINPYTNTITKRIPVGHPNVAWPNGWILDAGGYVWTCEAGNTMSEIDPRTNQVVAWYRVPESCQEIAYGDGSIWTALYDQSLVYRIDPKP